MPQSFFELLGAFATWALSGFKGKYEDQLEEEISNRHSIIGFVFFLLVFAGVIFVIRIAQ